MKKLPTISGKELIKILEKHGYYVRDQKGSHIHLMHPMKQALTIPNHKMISKGTLRAILKQAEINITDLEL